MERKLTAAHLKWLALVTMFIDHFAATVIEKYAYVNNIGLRYSIDVFSNSTSNLELAYFIMRLIGRLAFPIYIFLLVEGFMHTRDIKKYIARMAIFALISEIPFDLAFYGKFFETSHQNVFITMTLGLCMLYSLKFLGEKNTFNRKILALASICLFYYFNEYLRGDYGGYGIAFIAIIYIFRDQRPLQVIMMAIMGVYQLTALLAGPIVYFYNGDKGKQGNKYFFYGFYPAHLFILYLIERLII